MLQWPVQPVEEDASLPAVPRPVRRYHVVELAAASQAPEHLVAALHAVHVALVVGDGVVARHALEPTLDRSVHQLAAVGREAIVDRVVGHDLRGREVGSGASEGGASVVEGGVGAGAGVRDQVVHVFLRAHVSMGGLVNGGLTRSLVLRKRVGVEELPRSPLLSRHRTARASAVRLPNAARAEGLALVVFPEEVREDIREDVDVDRVHPPCIQLPPHVEDGGGGSGLALGNDELVGVMQRARRTEEGQGRPELVELGAEELEGGGVGHICK